MATARVAFRRSHAALRAAAAGEPLWVAAELSKVHSVRSEMVEVSLGSKRTMGSWSVGAVFQLGAKFGVGRCGGIEKTSLISLASEERRTRPHMISGYG